MTMKSIVGEECVIKSEEQGRVSQVVDMMTHHLNTRR